jgi:hypothetical protein
LQAACAARDVAFEWMQRIGCTVAIVVLHDEQVLVRDLLPIQAWPPTALMARAPREIMGGREG